ncbi:MAG: UDP-glucose 4-epimerase [Parcubacteria group bacterium Gr01-1014_44]|nr:MAG: UDP-glucose 4-epimerase [Parcubacteria group bacterium Gr01-1014_44]
MNSTRVVVTGGAGFIGSHLTDKLVARGYDVLVIDNMSLGKKCNLNSKANFYQEDIRNLKELRWIFWGVDYVFHCAAMPRIQPSIKNPDESFTNNLLGTHNVLMAAKEAGVKRVIYSGSSSVYGDQPELPLCENMTPRPKNPYAYDKWQAEERCLMFWKLFQMPVVCLRYFNVFGERQSTEGAYATVVGIFLRQKERGEPLTIVGDGKQRRDFTYVADVVEANISAMESAEAVGQVINIGTGANYSVNELADLVDYLGGKMVGKKHLPSRPGEAQETLADISKAQRLLNFKPTISLKDWIKLGGKTAG